MKKQLILVIFALLFAAFYFYRSSSSNPSVKGSNSTPSTDPSPAVTMKQPTGPLSMQLFVSQSCGHCQVVKDFIDDQKIDQKASIEYLEIQNDQENVQKLYSIASKCPNIDTSQGVGVPFAYIPTEDKCLIGDTPIIDYLSSRLNLSE